MRTRKLGDTGIEVSEIGVGAMQFGAANWRGPETEECVAIIDEAIRLGATFIDTAPAYAGGRSEEILGLALEGRRDQVVLCTKFGVWPDTIDFSADRIEESVEASLRRLRTDYLDVLLVHSPPSDVMDGTSAPHYRVLQRLKDSGVIRAYGVSGRDDTAAEIRMIAETTGSQAIEMRFNALYQEPAAAFEQAAKSGVGLIIKVPLESGWLSGKYAATSVFDEARSRWSAEDIARRARLVEEFQALLPAGVSTAPAALSHILAQPEVSTVAPGTKSLAQLRENVAAADVVLPDDTLAALRALGSTHADNRLPW
ncbi:aldo/keto reductase [Actinopolymorpha alba]|uniref:aldo/keto reductase n=1 Tax=Actinopolymorpha alba TaxID=533267 RepID=UPI00036AB9DD|nr:aldo/keto reductase [Actinopolymorpha alba]